MAVADITKAEIERLDMTKSMRLGLAIAAGAAAAGGGGHGGMGGGYQGGRFRKTKIRFFAGFPVPANAAEKLAWGGSPCVIFQC